MTRIICLSDTHMDSLDYLLKGQKADILIHAGDFCNSGSAKDWYYNFEQLRLVRNQFKEVITVFGNHDIYCHQNLAKVRKELMDAKIINLYNDSIYVCGIKFWGSPYTPRFGNWAFMKNRGNEIGAIWKEIPDDAQFVITHGPCFGILDETPRGESVGCWDLKYNIIHRVKTRFFVSGHIHQGYGKITINNTNFYNVAIKDEWYESANPITVIEI